MSELPKNWIEVRLGSIAKVQSGVGFPKKYQGIADAEYPVYKVGDVSKAFLYNSSLLSESENYVSSETLGVMKGNVFDIGTILFAKIGEALKLNRRVIVKKKGIADNNVMGVKAILDEEDDYLFRYLQSFDVAGLSRSTTVPSIRKTDVEDILVPLAPLNEQIRIANKLDSILAKVDKAQARLDKIPSILKRFRQSVLAAATSGELTKEWRDENTPIKHSEVTGKYELDWSIVEESALPESWQWVPLGNYAKCSRGKFSIRPRNDPSCFDGDYPFIQIGDLPRQGGFIYSHKQTLNEKGYSVSREFDAGTVVLAIVGATIANTGITTYPVCFPDSLVGINSASETTNKYLDYHLRAIKEDIRQASYAGGGQPNIKLTMVNPLPLPLPSEAEIVEIVAKVESLMARANKVEKQYLDAKARLDRLTQSILAKAFRGELVPQDSNDEPAEKLLERIVAEKELNKPKKAANKRTTKAKTVEKE
ncbi:restriction endonuclease subunit S [Photobacterium alginatilyticum]|uniref:Type I restriction modification DNA specificity domain-containing protein n=1 Tax=Photobacterium alginatilyticum TaxID=1775171 RepID=A0ABW9YS18_9GAMM|nr:hypothetical protein [Photobacterium alginatilyticum]